MMYRILADIAVFVHLFWILFLIFGVVIGIRSKVIKIIHISGLLFALILQVLNWYCPFTYLEVWLRAQHDPASTYTGSFIIHYIEKIVYFPVSRTTLFFMTLLLGSLNAWLYLKKKI
jgi:hypothetical protein